jgi:hypothetical protein
VRPVVVVVDSSGDHLPGLVRVSNSWRQTQRSFSFANQLSIPELVDYFCTVNVMSAKLPDVAWAVIVEVVFVVS